MLNQKLKSTIFLDLHSKAKEGGTPSTNDEGNYLNGVIPFVKIEDLGKKYITSTQTFITQKGLDSSSAWIIPPNSVLFSNGATIGSVSINKIPVATKQGILGIIPKINNEYFFYLLQTNSFLKEVKKRTTKGTFDAVYITDINKIKIKIHNQESHHKIGAFLSAIDRLIEKQKEKIELIKLAKNFYLNKMFPNKVKKVPKFRFKGFQEDWKKVSFQDVFDYYRPDNYIVSNEKYSSEYNTPVLTANKGFILGFTNENRTFNKPCVIFDDFTMDLKFVDFPFMVKSSAIKILLSKTNIDLRFAYELLKITKIENLGHARHYISVVQPTEVFVPSLKEQKTISAFFEVFDKSLKIQDKVLIIIEKIKKAHLQKIFAD